MVIWLNENVKLPVAYSLLLRKPPRRPIPEQARRPVAFREQASGSSATLGDAWLVQERVGMIVFLFIVLLWYENNNTSRVLHGQSVR